MEDIGETFFNWSVTHPLGKAILVIWFCMYGSAMMMIFMLLGVYYFVRYVVTGEEPK